MTTPEQGPLVKLNGHTPQQILEDRSLYTPPEPINADLAEWFWRNAEKEAESTLEHSVNSRLYHNSYLRTDSIIERRFPNVDQQVLSDIITLDSLEWYLHSFNPSEYRDNRSKPYFNSISGLVTGVINYQLPQVRETDENNLRNTSDEHLFVIPERYDGIVGNLLHSVGDYRNDRVRVIVIGNVASYFASGISQGASAVLYGSAGDRLADHAGGVVSKKGLRPVVTVHGDVGEHAASSASSLSLTVNGNAGDYLAESAGYAPEHHHTSDHNTSVFVRVNGRTGDSVADGAYGLMSISADLIGSLGDISHMQGIIHEGSYAPGTSKFKAYPGRILARDGQVLQESDRRIKPATNPDRTLRKG